MKQSRLLTSAIFAAVTIAFLANAVAGQKASDGAIATVTGSGNSVRWDLAVAHSGGTLTISLPDGRSVRRTFGAGNSPQINLGEKYLENPPDGVYVYELRLSPATSAAQKEAAKKERGKDDDPENERAARKQVSAPELVQSGSFAVVNGSIIVAGAVEPGQSGAKASAPARSSETMSANTARRIRNNHRAFFMPDQVIPDDLIVQGSACVGFDCVNGEVFGFDTIRMKENNTRLQFEDTSTTAGFSTNNWQIRANSSANGGGSFLAFVDQGNTGNSETGTIVLEVDAGAPANSLRVASTGRVGLRTATPVLDLHILTSNTPGVRLEQNSSGGFTAQTWDIAGNEANFFIRDVTSGSRLPFRIRPGAPTSSLDISATGNVGINTASPQLRLDVELPRTTTDFSNTLTYAAGFGNAAAGPGLNQKKVVVGYDETGHDIGLIQSVQFGVGFKNLALNPNGGNVGIGTTAPTQKLSVNGTAGKPGGGSWDVFSDERLKNIKGRFNLGLKAVMQLQPLRYEYKPDNPLGLKLIGEQIGFGAQELQKVIPEAVTRDSAGYLMVNNDPILWTMLNAIKEQQNAIKEQQKQIEDLKAEVEKLRAASGTRKN